MHKINKFTRVIKATNGKLNMNKLRKEEEEKRNNSDGRKSIYIEVYIYIYKMIGKQ